MTWGEEVARGSRGHSCGLEGSATPSASRLAVVSPSWLVRKMRKLAMQRVVCVLTLVLAGCEVAISPAPTIPISAAPSSAAETWPPGGPLPPELVGTWRPSDPASIGNLVFTSPSQYVFAIPRGDSAGGNVVVNGDEIAFFNAPLCGLRLPEGIGRYRWTIGGGELRFEPLNIDPCGREDNLRTRKYTKVR